MGSDADTEVMGSDADTVVAVSAGFDASAGSLNAHTYKFAAMIATTDIRCSSDHIRLESGVKRLAKTRCELARLCVV